jgi:hypothetical protein
MPEKKSQGQKLRHDIGDYANTPYSVFCLLRVDFLGIKKYLEHCFRDIIIKIAFPDGGYYIQVYPSNHFAGALTCMIGSMLFQSPPYINDTILTSQLPKVVSVYLYSAQSLHGSPPQIITLYSNAAD